MNLIKDIRFFSEHPDPVLEKYHIRGMKDIIQRLLFLLRHENFTFGDFDHLYMNYTPTLPHGEVRLSERPVDRYHPWFRFAEAGCDLALFKAGSLREQRLFLADTVRRAVHLHADAENCAVFDRCFERVMSLGSALEIPYREKTGEHLKLTISLTITDEADFLPIVRIFDPDGNLLREEHLRSYGRDEFLCQFRTITLGKRTATISISKGYGAERFKIAQLKYTI